MIFLTEDDAKQRCASGELCLKNNEHLTPSAAEMLRARNCRIILPGQCPTPPAPTASLAPAAVPTAPAPEATPTNMAHMQGTTHLDTHTVVSKAHPRIQMRGKLDTLIAASVVVQSQFDLKGKLPPLVLAALADINTWLWQILQAEVSGETLPGMSMAGMDAETLRTVSHNPQHYLGIDHIVPAGNLGPNVALLNWLRALVRETEVVNAALAPNRTDMLDGLNRLSTAVYVLMLLVVLAESGRTIPTTVKG